MSSHVFGSLTISFWRVQFPISNGFKTPV